MFAASPHEALEAVRVGIDEAWEQDLAAQAVLASSLREAKLAWVG